MSVLPEKSITTFTFHKVV